MWHTRREVAVVIECGPACISTLCSTQVVPWGDSLAQRLTDPLCVASHVQTCEQEVKVLAGGVLAHARKWCLQVGEGGC